MRSFSDASLLSRRRFPRIQILASLLLVVWIVGCAPKSSPFEIQPAQVPVEVRLPMEPGSVRFAVIGDSGTGNRRQYEVAQMLSLYHSEFQFDFVLMLGDNLYGRERPKHYREKFEEPYAELLDRNVRFYASLGNHDNPDQRFYRLFNMDGRRFYEFEQKEVAFFALDSNYMDPDQLEWIEQALSESDADWKISFFHHPLYSSGRKHGPDEDLRAQLEPLFVEHGVDVVFSGHEHFYERLKPQKGIYYFVSGAAAKLREGNIAPDEQTASGYDEDRSFLLLEISGSFLYFQAVSRTGEIVDSGRLRRDLPNDVEEDSRRKQLEERLKQRPVLISP